MNKQHQVCALALLLSSIFATNLQAFSFKKMMKSIRDIEIKTIDMSERNNRPLDIRHANVKANGNLYMPALDLDNTPYRQSEEYQDSHTKVNESLSQHLERSTLRAATLAQQETSARKALKLKQLIEEKKQSNEPPLDIAAETKKDPDWFKKRLIAFAQKQEKEYSTSAATSTTEETTKTVTTASSVDQLTEQRT